MPDDRMIHSSDIAMTEKPVTTSMRKRWHNPFVHSNWFASFTRWRIAIISNSAEEKTSSFLALLLECGPHVLEKFATLIRHQGSPRSCRKHRISSQQKCHSLELMMQGTLFETSVNSLKRHSANACTSNEPLIPDLVFRVGLNHETVKERCSEPKEEKGEGGGSFWCPAGAAIFSFFLSGLNPELKEWRVSNPERRGRGVQIQGDGGFEIVMMPTLTRCVNVLRWSWQGFSTRRVHTQARFQSQVNARPSASNVDLGPHADQKTPRVPKRVRHAYHACFWHVRTVDGDEILISFETGFDEGQDKSPEASKKTRQLEIEPPLNRTPPLPLPSLPLPHCKRNLGTNSHTHANTLRYYPLSHPSSLPTHTHKQTHHIHTTHTPETTNPLNTQNSQNPEPAIPKAKTQPLPPLYAFSLPSPRSLSLSPPLPPPQHHYHHRTPPSPLPPSSLPLPLALLSLSDIDWKDLCTSERFCFWSRLNTWWLCPTTDSRCADVRMGG